MEFMKRTAGIFLLNTYNEVLICHPTGAPKNMWSIPKGLVESLDRNEYQAAERELYEETNINLSNIFEIVKETKRLEFQYYKKQKKVLVPYLVRIKTTGYDLEIKCNSYIEGSNKTEVDDFKWCNIYDCLNILHETQINSCKEIIERFLDK